MAKTKKTKKSKGVPGQRFSPAAAQALAQKLVDEDPSLLRTIPKRPRVKAETAFGGSRVSATRPHHINWNDSTLEVYAPNGVACSMPICCSECEGQFWLGEVMVAVSYREMVHDECFADYAKRSGLRVGDEFGKGRA